MKDRWGSTGKREAHLCCLRKHLSAAVAVSLPHAGMAYKVFQSPVIPLISGEWVVSHVWHEILRLSSHLFWLGVFTHGAFSSAQDDDTGERIGSQGWCAAFLEDGISVSQPFPLGKGAPQGRIG